MDVAWRACAWPTTPGSRRRRQGSYLLELHGGALLPGRSRSRPPTGARSAAAAIAAAPPPAVEANASCPTGWASWGGRRSTCECHHRRRRRRTGRPLLPPTSAVRVRGVPRPKLPEQAPDGRRHSAEGGSSTRRRGYDWAADGVASGGILGGGGDGGGGAQGDREPRRPTAWRRHRRRHRRRRRYRRRRRRRRRRCRRRRGHRRR